MQPKVLHLSAVIRPIERAINYLPDSPHSMSLIKSVSGIRGIVGGKYNRSLTAVDITECTAAYAQWIINSGKGKKVVIGRDGRLSGELVSRLVCTVLQSMGIDVIDAGLSTTPTIEMYVTHQQAAGGIILTASHNPRQWNALKLLNHKGEFLSAADGDEIYSIARDRSMQFAAVDDLGTYTEVDDAINYHIDQIMDLKDLVKANEIAERAYHVLVDCINSTGAISIPALLDRLGCKYTLLNAEHMGEFAHNPEPLAVHLQESIAAMKSGDYDLGIIVDPDVDRLALIDADGNMIGEEYTLVTVADYVLSHRSGDTVSNMSSSRALRDVTRAHGYEHHASQVGEAHVVAKMKEVRAPIGGEGNGGVILPELHYGRDALAGIALVLSYMASSGKSLKELRASYQDYYMAKLKCSYDDGLDVQQVLEKIASREDQNTLNQADGLKIDLEEGWVHLRRSNTEPIIRVYTESTSPESADSLGNKYLRILDETIASL